MSPALLAALLLAPDGSPGLRVEPARVRPGDAVMVTVRGPGLAPEGELAGRPLAFYPVEGGHRALAALPLETAPGRLPVAVSLAGEGGQRLGLEGAVEVGEPGFASRELAVAGRFLRPPPEARRRMRRDQAAFRRAFAVGFAPPLFAGNFAWPLESEVTATFGDQRTFNGRKKSQHYGTDLSAPVGAPVAAANDGRVVLVRDCYASGRSVVVWHGADLFSVYFHLSRFRVRGGQAVRRGDVLGLVGQTGRVTGPHLHWGMKLGGIYVDPESVLRLDLDGSGRTAARRVAPAAGGAGEGPAAGPAAAGEPDRPE